MTKSFRTLSKYVVGTLAFVALTIQARDTLAQQAIDVLVVFTDDAKEAVETSLIFDAPYANDLNQYVDGVFAQANAVLVENFQNNMLTLPAVLVPVGIVWDLNDNLGGDYNELAHASQSHIVEDIQEHMSSYMIGSASIEAVRQAYGADLVLVVNRAGVLGGAIGAAGEASPSNNFHPNVATVDAIFAGAPSFPEFQKWS